jgi:hypothetical protein
MSRRPSAYDGADFDEAVVAVVSATGLVGTPVLLTRPADIHAEPVRPHPTVLGAATLSSTFSIRAPPARASFPITASLARKTVRPTSYHARPMR